MENIKNLNVSEQTEVNDPLATLWGIYYSEIAPTGRIDSEYSAFKNIETRFLNGEISSKEEVEKEAWAIVNGRLEYN